LFTPGFLKKKWPDLLGGLDVEVFNMAIMSRNGVIDDYMAGFTIAHKEEDISVIFVELFGDADLLF
jgi:hypothetical protein